MDILRNWELKVYFTKLLLLGHDPFATDLFLEYFQKLLTQESQNQNIKKQNSDGELSSHFIYRITRNIVNNLNFSYFNQLAKPLFQYMLSENNNIRERITGILESFASDMVTDDGSDVCNLIAQYLQINGQSLTQKEILFYLSFLDRFIWSYMPSNFHPSIHISIMREFLTDLEKKHLLSELRVIVKKFVDFLQNEINNLTNNDS